MSKLGVSSSFNLCFLVTSEYFPVMHRATVFGACNIIARLISIFSPLIAEINPPIPMIIYGVFCVLGVLGISFLSKDTKDVTAIDIDKAASPINRNSRRNVD